mmetsp:Transcript_11320/g.25336  ORF Transcript_11320/g.25336 Transcript_11320/m.25336 type:complete len:445 (+) Transcript_11320:127-1461(+)
MDGSEEVAEFGEPLEAVLGDYVLSSAAPTPMSRYPEWCDPSPRLFTYVCEQAISAPIWSAVFLADILALWLIFSILRRQCQQNLEVRRAKLAIPKAVRARRLWGVAGAVAQLAAMAAPGTVPHPAGSVGQAAGSAETWRTAWDKVAKARFDRKDYLVKVDFGLSAVFTRAFGPVLMTVMSTLIFFEVHAYFTVGVPLLDAYPRLRLLAQGIGVAFSSRIVLDYARTSFTDPGQPQEASADDIADAQDTELGRCGQQEMRRCLPCGRPKPPRCHHCKVCRRCILKMDHHCPFVNNCVGLRNYRYFCWFLLDLVVGCVCVMVSLLPHLPEIVSRRSKATFAHEIHVMAAFAGALISASVLSPFFLFHMQLIVLNETTLEHMKNRMARLQQSRTPAHRGVGISYSRGALDNFSDVCGSPPFWCRRHVEDLLNWLVPSHVAKLAKRSS